MTSLVALGRTCAPREGNNNTKLKPLLIINRYLPLKFHVKVNYALEYYCAYCKVIAKVVNDIAGFTTALNFMAEYS